MCLCLTLNWYSPQSPSGTHIYDPSIKILGKCQCLIPLNKEWLDSIFTRLKSNPKWSIVDMYLLALPNPNFLVFSKFKIIYTDFWLGNYFQTFHHFPTDKIVIEQRTWSHSIAISIASYIPQFHQFGVLPLDPTMPYSKNRLLLLFLYSYCKDEVPTIQLFSKNGYFMQQNPEMMPLRSLQS